MEEILNEIIQLEKRLNILAEENGLQYIVNSAEKFNLKVDRKYSIIKINVVKQLR